MARPSKYDQAVKPYINKIEEWKRVGATDDKICELLGIARSTFLNTQKT